MEPTHGQRASCRVKPVNVDDGLEGIMWVRCLGGVRLPTASYVLCPNLNKLFFSPREEGSRFFVACFLPTSRRYTFDLDVESTHGQPASCRARTVNIDDDLQKSMWIHGLGGETLLLTSYALCPNTKNAYFCHRRWIEISCNLFSIHRRSNAWQAPAIYHRPSCELCGPRVGRSP